MNEVRLEIPEIAEKINLKLKEESPVKLETLESVSIAAPTYHRDLLGLDYESSGHTGFASAAEVKLLLPKDISILPKNNLQNRQAKVYLYDTTLEQKETQVSVQDLLDSKIKTVESVPNNLQNGDYIFLERK